MADLLTWRKSAKLSQEAAAKLVGVSQVTWSEWERGEATPTITHALRIEEITEGSITIRSWAEPKTDAQQDAEVST